jgi:nuclear pore complex protein Nup155
MTGVFIEQVEYLLVVSTPVEIIILGLAFCDNHRKNRVSRGELQIYLTQMSVLTDNIGMTEIIGTDNGRIIMAGENGHLYEFLYQVGCCALWLQSVS